MILRADGIEQDVTLTDKRAVARAVLDAVVACADASPPTTDQEQRVSRWTFTSESVTEGHPDKMADQISDAILDAILAEDPIGRVACETLLTTGLRVVAGEITTEAYVDIPKIVRETINGIGYDRESFGFDGNTCGVIVVDRRAVARHRPGRRHRRRDAHAARAARTSSTARAPATRG